MKIKDIITSKNNNSGITLIALVITIIVLLILAGVTIASLTGENGLLERASRAKGETEVAQEKEQLLIEVLGSTIDKTGDLDFDTLKNNIKSHLNVDNITSTNFPLSVTYTASKNTYEIDGAGNVAPGMKTVAIAPTEPVAENTKYDDGTNKADGTSIAVIPKGFKVINNDENQPKIDDGLVVKDGANNEWVWIPVPDASVMYTYVDEGIAITGGSGKTYVSGVTTNYYSKSGIISDKTRGLPNTTSYREPDVVVYTDGTGYDAVEENYSAAGFTSLQNMAQSLADDYEKMIKSVEKNKGFYVGRYELSGTVASPTEVSGTPLTNQNWYNLYKACKGFTVEGVVEARMIWGCQWDVVCKYISERGDKKDITNSTTWGNYNNSESPANVSGYRSKQNTGFSEFWKANEIYDIAGNCYEWTQEASYTNRRAYRSRLLRQLWLILSSFLPQLQPSH